MRYLTLKEILELHRRIVEQSGGLKGIRDAGLLESALAQPLMTFGGEELYPTISKRLRPLAFPLSKIISSLMAINESATLQWKLFLF
jgi:death-on-curing protein